MFKLPTQEILVNYLEQCKYIASCQTKEKSVSQSDVTGLTKSFKMYIQYSWVSQVAHVVKNPPTMRETWIPEFGRSPGEGNSCPLQYSGLENFMDRAAWQATVQGLH